MDLPVSQKACSKCGEVKSLEQFPRDARARGGRRADCKVCNKQKSALYREDHPDQCREAVARCRAANGEQYQASRRARYDPEEGSERNRRYREANRDQLNEANRQYRDDVRTRVFDHYGRTCACCGVTENLTIDHVNGGGTQHRLESHGHARVAGWVFYRWLIKNGFPDGFQVLCSPCNQSKWTGERCRLNHEDRAPAPH